MRLTRVPAVLLSLVALASCAAPPPEPAEMTRTHLAADGPTIEGSGYSFRVPSTWGPGPGEVAGIKVDSSAVNLQDNDSFQDNINVIFSPAGPMSPDEIETRALSGFDEVGAEIAEVRSRVEVAGERVPHIAAVLGAEGGPKWRVDQFYITDREDTHIVTFSSNATATMPERVALWSPVLATWQWRE